MYFLKVSGKIPPNKQKEFQQTFRLFGEQMPADCSGYSFAKDLLEFDTYDFFSYWKQNPSLQSFRRSDAFFILIGAFKTLGHLSETYSEKRIVNNGFLR